VVSMKASVGILAAAVQLPADNRTVADLFHEEGVTYSPDIEARLGIQRVPIRNGESGSNMAVEAARRALKLANVDPAQVDVIVEYSILPQEYLVPVWNMSNKVQGEIGAGKSFVVGFSGGGATNYLVALSSAVALLQENDNLKTALLVTADVTIPGNRVLNPVSPVTVMGDAASAVVLQKGAATTTVLDTELWSEGANHDICYIPGGSLVHPDNADLYRLELDQDRYRAFPKADVLHKMSHALLKRAGLTVDDIAAVLYPNVSSEDQAVCQQTFGNKMAAVCASNLSTHGHLQGSDFVVNYLSLMESGAMQKGNHIMIASHGMGALAGASLLQC
jgi:3-oxoacyl-[acyl-carrier-protein] synthase III